MARPKHLFLSDMVLREVSANLQLGELNARQLVTNPLADEGKVSKQLLTERAVAICLSVSGIGTDLL
jgi:hypothetical protein